jgi:hypothetical protein
LAQQPSAARRQKSRAAAAAMVKDVIATS